MFNRKHRISDNRRQITEYNRVVVWKHNIWYVFIENHLEGFTVNLVMFLKLIFKTDGMYSTETPESTTGVVTETTSSQSETDSTEKSSTTGETEGIVFV